MSETESIPTTFHAMSRSQRDHLLAVGDLHPDQPSGQAVQRRVERLRDGERPSNTTTYSTLSTLADWGFVTTVDKDAKTTGYRLADRGAEILEAAAALMTP